AVGKDAEHAHRAVPAGLLLVGQLVAVQQADVELVEPHLRELRVMPLEDFAHRVVDRVHRSAAARRDELFFAEDVDHDRGLGRVARLFGKLKIDLVVDLALEDAKRLQIIFAPADRHQFERGPSSIQAEECLFEISSHGSPPVSSRAKAVSYYTVAARAW